MATVVVGVVIRSPVPLEDIGCIPPAEFEEAFGNSNVNQRFEAALNETSLQYLRGGSAREWPGVSSIAMAHLTMGSEVADDDFLQPIHQIGTIDALPLSVIGDSWAYAALGHILRRIGRASHRSGIDWFWGVAIWWAPSKRTIDAHDWRCGTFTQSRLSL